MLLTGGRAAGAIRIFGGRRALVQPRRALLAATLVLAVAGMAWLMFERPWNDPSVVQPNVGGEVSAAELTERLARSGYGPGRSDVRVLVATPEYFRVTGQSALVSRYRPDINLVLFVWENTHEGDLGAPLAVELLVDGTPGPPPVEIVVPADAAHHRFSVVSYAREAVASGSRLMELVLPPVGEDGDRSVLQWSLPLESPRSAGLPQFQWSVASALALAGGVLSSMWPCLFQLTAYFIPTLAGISMSQQKTPVGSRLVRLRLIRTAAFFAAGFVIVYTLAGAMAGLAAQSFGGASFFWEWRRPISIAAGLIVLFVAVRLAVNARAPLVCKMPVISNLKRKKTGYLGTMVLGVAFAAGCTTCFGAALVLGIFTYVGIAGSPLSGALVMFLFAIGMAIPLIAGAAAMARALTALGRLERVGRYLILASSLVMAVFAALLLSGRSMWLSNLFLNNNQFGL